MSVAPIRKRARDSHYRLVQKERDAAMRIFVPSDSLSVKQPRIYTELERQTMGTFESVDAFEPRSAVYQEHLHFRFKEPRWFIWIFTVIVGALAGLSAIAVVSLVHVASSMKFHLLDIALRGFPTMSSEEASATASAVFGGEPLPMTGLQHRSVGLGYVAWAGFSVTCALLSALIMSYVPAARGVGTPEVLANLNGVENLSMIDARVFFAKIALTVLNMASGACMGYYGALMQIGVMIASFVTARSRWIEFPNINVVRCFRNPRDRRVIAIIGAAAGVGSAFSVTIGGLMFVVEQVAQTLPARTALYTFGGCLVSAFTLQTYFSYMNAFSTRDRRDTPSGGLLTDVLLAFDTQVFFAPSVPMNIFALLPTLVIGVLCGLLAALFTRMSWVSLRIRRRLQYKYFGGFKFIEPVIIILLYVSVTYWITVLWGGAVEEEDSSGSGCSTIPSYFADRRRDSVVGLYGIVSNMCDPGPASVNGSDIVPNGAMHNFGTLSMGFADSTIQLLFSYGTRSYISPLTLAVFLVVYFIFASFTTGAAMSGDVLMPAMVIGATVGRLVGQLTYDMLRASGTTVEWAEPGVFALIGAGSFLGGSTGLTFSVCIILMEMTGNITHVVCLMIGVSIAKSIAERFSHSITASFLEASCVPVLDFASRVHKYDMFCARHVMRTNVVTFTSVMLVGDIVNALNSTTHNGFPVISFTDGTYKGMILRWQLEGIMWNVHWARTTEACTYDRLREIEDRRFFLRLNGLPPLSLKAQRRRIDLLAHVDQSAYCIQEATSVSRTYQMFRTLGLRHLVVVDRGNIVVGIITRKDLVTDRLLERIHEENERRLALGLGDHLQDTTTATPSQFRFSKILHSATGLTRPVTDGESEASQRLLPDGPANLYDDAIEQAARRTMEGYSRHVQDPSDMEAGGNAGDGAASALPQLKDLVVDEFEDVEEVPGSQQRLVAEPPQRAPSNAPVGSSRSATGAPVVSFHNRNLVFFADPKPRESTQ